MSGNAIFEDHLDLDAGPSGLAIQRWGGLASFLMAPALIIAHYIYLTGDLADNFGPLTYSLADVLYGPVWAAGLVTAVYALRERIGDRAPRLLCALYLVGGAAALAVIVFPAWRGSPMPWI